MSHQLFTLSLPADRSYIIDKEGGPQSCVETPETAWHCSYSSLVPLQLYQRLMFSLSNGTQEVEQMLQLCGITICVRYTLKHVPTLHALNEELKVLVLTSHTFHFISTLHKATWLPHCILIQIKSVSVMHSLIFNMVAIASKYNQKSSCPILSILFNNTLIMTIIFLF